jgi:hypothetical protein
MLQKYIYDVAKNIAKKHGQKTWPKTRPKLVYGILSSFKVKSWGETCLPVLNFGTKKPLECTFSGLWYPW